MKYTYKFLLFVDHSYVRKWLLLTDPSEFDNSPRGYLKFSISLLGAGDMNPYEVSLLLLL